MTREGATWVLECRGERLDVPQLCLNVQPAIGRCALVMAPTLPRFGLAAAATAATPSSHELLLLLLVVVVVVVVRR